MVCLFPMSERANTKPQVHRCSCIKCVFRVCGYVRYEILGQKEARAKEEIRCRAATGPFGPHYNGSISSFSPLWLAAPLTMNKGCRPASCQVVSTPFSATLWPTPRSLLRLHSLETGFCSGQIDVLMEDKFCFCWELDYWIFIQLLRTFSLSVFGQVLHIAQILHNWPETKFKKVFILLENYEWQAWLEALESNFTLYPAIII